MALPRRHPSKPDLPSFPKPATTRPSGCAPSSRIVLPAWFSKPDDRLPLARVELALDQHVSDQSPVPGDRVQREDACAGLLLARSVAIEPAEQLVAAADGEHDRAAGHRISERCAARRRDLAQ